MRLILASSSPSRTEALQRLQASFIAAAPDIDERTRPDESPIDLVNRLSIEKAVAMAHRFDHHIIIAGDQILALGKKIMGKSHTHANAIAQLTECSGKKACFYTGLCVLNSKTMQQQVEIVETHVEFLPLSSNQIEAYLKKDEPYQCAGSIRFEGSALLLFASVESPDPSAITGMPIMALSRMLLKENYSLLEPISC
jgi:MAF protein